VLPVAEAAVALCAAAAIVVRLVAYQLRCLALQFVRTCQQCSVAQVATERRCSLRAVARLYQVGCVLERMPCGHWQNGHMHLQVGKSAHFCVAARVFPNTRCRGAPCAEAERCAARQLCSVPGGIKTEQMCRSGFFIEHIRQRGQCCSPFAAGDRRAAP